MATSTGVKYIGKDAVYEDNILRTGLSWEKGEVHVLPTVMAKEFLKHPTVFQETAGGWPVLSTTSESGNTLGGVVATSAAGAQYSIAALPAGFVIPHRGSGALIGPQKTWAGFETGLAIGRKMGAPILDIDVKSLADGFVVWHDDTWDAYSTATGTVSDTPASAARNIVIDSSTRFGGGSSNQTGACFADEFFARYAGKACFSVEPKDAAAATYLVKLLTDIGLKDACLINSFTAAWLAPFIAAGFPHILYNVTSGVANSAISDATMRGWKSTGYTWVGLPWNSLVANATVAKNAGLKVLVTTPSRRYQRDLWAGVYDAIASDDPMYIAGLNPKRLASSFKYGAYGHGIQNVNADEAPGLRGFFDSGRFRRDLTTESKWWCLIGEIELPATFTLTLKVRVNGTPADATKPIGLFFCAPTDTAFNRAAPSTDTGYYATLAPNGGMTLRTYPNGSDTTTGTAAALVADTDVTITIAVTATTVSMTVGGVTISRTNSSTRGPYLYLGCENGATTMSVSFSDLAVTPT